MTKKHGSKDRTKDRSKKNKGGATSASQQELRIAGAVGGAVLLLYIILLMQASGDAAPVALSADDPSALREVFSSGEPWLVWCSDSVDGTQLSSTHSIIEQAAPLLREVSRVGILDCSALLPSGKSTYDKLGLNSSVAPTMFFVANAQKPRQLQAKHAKSAKALVSYASTHAEPKLRRPTSSDDLQKGCLSARWCAILLTDGKLVEPHKSDASELMRSFRGVQFSAVDASKYRLTTSPKLLKKGEVKEPSMLLVHRAKLGSGKSTTFARLHRGDMMASGGAGDVLEEALELKDNGRPGGKGWVKLTATPSLTYRRGASQSKTPDSDGADPPPETSTWEEADEVQAGLKAKRDALKAERDAKAAESRGQRSKDADSRAARREQLKAKRAEEAEAALERERQAERERTAQREQRRRQEMEREAQESLGIEQVDPESHADGEDEHIDAEVDDEVVLLDDDWDEL